MKHPLALFLLTSCVTAKPVAQVYVPPHVETQQGYVVPPYGDSALFTGIAMAVQGCDFPNALTDQILIDDGLIRRHPSDPKPHDPSSRDMVIGAMLGLVSRFNRCPQDRKAIQWAWAAHMAYVKNGKLYPGAGPDKSLTPGLKFLWQSVGAHFGVADAPENPALFRSSLITTATLIREQRAACYPIHLGYLQIRIAELVGRPVDSLTKLFFCAATNGTDLPLVDQYCERPVKWRDGFEYQSQRCGWESPDSHDSKGRNLDRVVFEAVKFGYSGITKKGANFERITRHPSPSPVAGPSH